MSCEGTGQSLAAKCVACLGNGKCDYCDGTGRAVKKSLFEWLGDLAKGKTRKRVRQALMWKRHMTPKEAAQVIDRFLAENSLYPQEWTDFAETRQQDARVEQYRKRCDQLSPLVNRPGEMDRTAVSELRSIIEELRSLD
jgi:hypothetical protein